MPKKTKFEIRNRVAQKLYEDESDEIKEEVEEHRHLMKEGRGESRETEVDDRNRQFQR